MSWPDLILHAGWLASILYLAVSVDRLKSALRQALSHIARLEQKL